eukprot:95609_1
MALTDQSVLRLILHGVELFFIWLIIAPLILYHTVQYYKSRNRPQITKRHTSLVIAMSIFILVYTTAGRTVSLCRTLELHLINRDVTVWIDTIFYIVGCYSIIHIILWRILMLNFRIRYTMIIEKGAWMRHINTKSAEKGNWYATHRSTRGNLKWMLRWFIPILCLQFVICLMTSSAVDLVGRIVYHATIALLTLLLIIAIWIVYCKTPRYMDVFRLCDELRYMLYIGMIGCILWVTVAVIENIGSLSQETVSVVIIINELMVDAVFGAIGMVSTYWVLRHSIIESEYNTVANVSNSIMASAETNGKNYLNLAKFLSKPAGVYSFMTYLCREFNSENLLFIYECSQFKQLCAMEMSEIPRMCTAERKDLESIWEMIVLPDGLPRSDIVCSDGSVHDKFMRLTEKYILADAQFQINVSYKCMECVCDKYSCGTSMTHAELYSMFDEAMQEITGLMDNSYTRFCRTEQYIAALNDAF